VCFSNLIVQFFHDFFQLGANHSEEANNNVTAERQLVGGQNITITSLNLINSNSSAIRHSSKLAQKFSLNFSNSLIIHQVKTKEITITKEVWIPSFN